MTKEWFGGGGMVNPREKRKMRRRNFIFPIIVATEDFVRNQANEIKCVLVPREYNKLYLFLPINVR